MEVAPNKRSKQINWISIKSDGDRDWT